MKENAKYRIYNRLNAFANVIMIAVGGSVGLLIGSSVLKYMEYRDNPVKYEIQSAPWYTGILIGGVLIAVLFVVSLGHRGNRLLRVGLALLLGGAFSNTYDRLKRKYVVDYLSFGVRWKGLRRIVFNVSDFCILIGAMLSALGAD